MILYIILTVSSKVEIVFYKMMYVVLSAPVGQNTPLQLSGFHPHRFPFPEQLLLPDINSLPWPQFVLFTPVPVYKQIA